MKPWPVSAPIRPTTSTGSATTSSISARRPRRCPSCSQPAPSRQVSARKRDQRALYEVLARIVAMALAVAGEGEAVLGALGVDHFARDHLEVTLLLPMPAAHVAAIEPD